MSARHLSRSIVLQNLFAWDFNKEESPDIKEIVFYNISNFGQGLSKIDFIQNLTEGILDKIEKLDEIIKKAATEWPIEQIAIIDRNVLRIGLYELLFEKEKEVPPKVAINEAIELAKTFGGDTSGKFVNGVLGAIYKEISKEEDVDFKETLVGALIYKKEIGIIKFAFVRDIFGYWTLSKGKIDLDKEKDMVKIVKQTVKKELGIDIEVKDNLGENEYTAYEPQKGKVLKKVIYYLAETKEDNLKLEDSDGLLNAKWFESGELQNIKTYNDIFPFLMKALKILIEIKN